MSERYSRLFTLPENLYAENAPVVISAGALLKDNQTGKVIAQLKLKNISSKSIKVAKVKISPMDSIGNPLGDAIESQYLDLNAQRDEEFGQKQAIQLPDISTRKMIVSVTEVFFSDNTSWVSGGEVWETLSGPVLRANDNATEQFRMDFGFDEYKPIYNISEHKGLLYCACGALNRAEEDSCHVCKNKFSVLKNVSWEDLADKAEKRIAEAHLKAQKETELKEQKTQENKKKIKKYVQITAVLTIIIASVSLFVTKYFVPNQKYNDAVAMMEKGSYTVAISAFEALEGFKDSETMITECKYRSAVKILDEGNYSKAIDKFIALGDYKDSETMILECNYRNAVELMNEDNEIFAYDIFVNLEDYKDCKEKANSIYNKHCPKKLDEASVGDYVLFGKYEQDNDTSNGKEDIEWLVLDVEDDKLLVISKYALDYKRFTATDNFSWEDCMLRKWMNDDFLNEAFSAEELKMIPTSEVTYTYGMPNYDINEERSCEDRIFLLMKDDAMNKYFHDASSRKCKYTKYASAKFTKESPYVYDLEIAKYWLSGVLNYDFWGHDNGSAIECVGESGFCNDMSESASAGVRPVMWINLSEI